MTDPGQRTESGRVRLSIELEPVQVQYLGQMMARYNVPDVAKALRVLVNYAMAMPDQEEPIFKKTRCRHCV